MYTIQQITSDSLQQQVLILPDGSQLLIEMYFRPMQFGWFFNQIVYNDFTLTGLRICNSPNMLYQWRNLIPFGIACTSIAQREPSQEDDFSSGASTLYLLTEAEVAEYTAFLQDG